MSAFNHFVSNLNNMLLLVEGLPKGLRPVRFGVMDAQEYYWDGCLRRARRSGGRPQLVVEVMPGYEVAYDIRIDGWGPSRIPPPVPESPLGADWLEFAGFWLQIYLDRPLEFRPEEFPPWLGDCAPARGTDVWPGYKRASAVIDFFYASADGLADAIKRRMLDMAADLDDAVATGNQPMAQGVTHCALEVRRGVALRYVLARDAERGWAMRFDVISRTSNK